MSFEKSRILVTGGNGFLGSTIVEKLKKKNYTNCEIRNETRRDY